MSAPTDLVAQATTESRPMPSAADITDMDTYNTILGLNALKNSTTAAPPTLPAPSSNGSSSLSELDDDHIDSAPFPVIPAVDVEEGDSEAETELLADSPRKPRDKPALHRAASSLKHAQSANDDGVSEEEDGMDVNLLSQSKQDAQVSRSSHETPLNTTKSRYDDSRMSPNTLAGTKRKRSSLPEEGTNKTTEPLSKRMGHSAQHGTVEAGKTHLADDSAEEEESALQSDVSDITEVSYTSSSQDEDRPTSGGGPEVLAVTREVAKPEPDTSSKTKADVDKALGAGGNIRVTEPEVEEEDEEDEEAETLVKGEDEMARKLKAMSDLAPIEKLFNMFRDKLHEERLAALDAELRVLQEPSCTHPEIQAQRQCIDVRRDEKIHLEQVAARLRQECLERTIVGQRAQIHCQYFQEARQVREDCVSALNEMYCRIQQERRQMKAQEPHFLFNFEPKRSKRIAYQTAYNKEVSVLSGIARHVGFPAAPEITGARQSEVEDDFRAMA